MDSKEEGKAEEQPHNTTLEKFDGSTTMTLQKKRARRVSFAERTSVHFFDRDSEDNGTPPMEAEKLGGLGFDGQLEHLKDLESNDDDTNGDEDPEDIMEMRSFFHPIGSPSPGGSTICSASSNDEDNFFGPVSANFIRPGRLSHSAASDDNHDVTLDSTAFSMHFRSLARSDSGVELKTPTEGRLLFEEKTPTNGNQGSMTLTFGKKLSPNSSLPVTDASVNYESNDMSLVGNNFNEYDYEKLSPELESNNYLHSISACDGIIASKSPTRMKSRILLSTEHGDSHVNEIVSAACIELNEANCPLRSFRAGHSPQKFSYSASAEATNTAHYRTNRSPHCSSKTESETPLLDATSSPVKQQPVLPTTASPSKHLIMVTPLPDQPGSFLRKESLKHSESKASIQKSISKLDLLEKSAVSSAFSVKIDYSTIRSLDFVGSPNSVTEERLTRAHQSKEMRSAFGMDTNRIETLNDSSNENLLEESSNHILNGKLPNDLNVRILYADQPEYRGDAVSPTKVNYSGNSMMRGLSPSKSSREDIVMAETDSILAEIVTIAGRKEIVTPMSVSSPSRMLQKKNSASPGLQSSQYKNLTAQNPFKDSEYNNKGRDSTPERNLVDVNISRAAGIQDAVSMGMKGESRPLNVEVNHHRGLTEAKETGNREVSNNNVKEKVGPTNNFITHNKEKTLSVMHSEALDVSNQISRSIFRFEDNNPGGDSAAVTPFYSRNVEESRLQKDLVEHCTSSLSRKEFDNILFSSIQSPKSIQLSSELERFSANKRNVEVLLLDTQHRTEMTIMQRSPKFQKGETCDLETRPHPSGCSEGTAVTGYERKQWMDIYSKLSESMQQLISCSADELSTKMIDELEEMLVHRQRSKKYELLASAIQNTPVLHDPQLERVAEANSLLYQIVFEKAKLQLKRVKRERLLKRSQLMSSKIQESQILKTKMSSQPFSAYTTNVVVDGDQSLFVKLKKRHEVHREEVTAMTQSLEALDIKILNLKKSVHSYCKIQADPSCDTISLVNEHLKKRACCRFIRERMQMWRVHSVGSANGQHNVVLNYLEFIVQSINVIVGPTPNVSTSFTLNETNIMKNIPNMEACTAFTFVFSAGTTYKYVGPKTLIQETQVASSLLGTLLDVVEEVQTAQVEFHNLTQSNFCSPSVDQLDLMLCFFDFNTGRKVVLTLDMSCLKRGIYPSDAIPLETSFPVDRKQLPLPGLIFNEIRDAVKGVRTGYKRILRLCSCVSQALQVPIS